MTELKEINIIQAINYALDHALKADNDVILLGQDIGKNGGVFRASINLENIYGSDRVIDMPLAENLIAGAAVGMACQGLKPIAELQFMGFIYPAIDQIINHASRMRNRTRGRLTCPIVYRAPYSGGIGAPEHHSESTEAMFAHIPGIRVVIPSSPARAYGLLLAAINNPDPVIFLEPKKIYRNVKQKVLLDGKEFPLDRAFLMKEGNDITIISWGATLYEALKATKHLESNGMSIELIDLATIKPIDSQTIINSVKKTGKCIIAHEANKTCGVGAEIAAIIADECFYNLKAPIKRITGSDCIMPYYKLEKEFLVSDRDIIKSAISIMEGRNDKLSLA